MRLNRLEIAGFKSFPDRSELTFDQGVTAIVGPNGCGKSNVVDALTWVLGEQSAKSLRGDRMEDVIFGGSDARKPTGAAEVRLRLSGVAARGPATARAGNGHQAAMAGRRHCGDRKCRNGGRSRWERRRHLALEDDVPLIVRDVELMRRLYGPAKANTSSTARTAACATSQDLLMDSGLGVKAYAVIEQGKIGQILSARPTDRRQLIEEAAGVTKYKSRRRAAELKLEAAQQNLTRVDDIVYEVEKQRGALKRQAAKARRYRRLREELRRWEKVQFARRYPDARRGDRGRPQQARGRPRPRSVRRGRPRRARDDPRKRLRLELTEADAPRPSAREAAHARELEIGRLQQQIAFDRHQIEQLAASAVDIDAEVRALEARREPARLELEARREAAARRRRRQAAGRRSARRGGERVRRPAARHRGSRGGRRGGAQRGVRRGQCRDRAAACDGARRRGQVADRTSSSRSSRSRAATCGSRRSAPSRTGRGRAGHAAGAGDARRPARRSGPSGTRSCRRRAPNASARASSSARSRPSLAGVTARLTSLEELDAARAEYGDGARLSSPRRRPTRSVRWDRSPTTSTSTAIRARRRGLPRRPAPARRRAHARACRGRARLAADDSAGRVGFVIAAAGRRQRRRALMAAPAGVRRSPAT